MDDYTKMAMEMVKAQASVRVLSPEEIISMVKVLSIQLKALAENQQNQEVSAEEQKHTTEVGKKSIKENSIVCMECGKAFKIITKKHLARHGMTPEEYRLKYGIKKGAALATKSLVRARKKKMQEMQLWKKRGAGASKK